MYALSAADAIAPAIQRTRSFLFRPFRWSTFLKLSLVALITEGFATNFNSSWSRSQRASGQAPAVSPPFHLLPWQIAAIAAASLLAIALGLLIAYLVTRLRFAYFHCLIHNSKEIRPGWRLYRAQSARFFWMNVAVGLCFMVLVALAALPFATGLWRLLRDTPAGGHPSPGMLIALILPLVPIVLLFILAAVVLDVILRDWMLPHYALENATARQAWAAVQARISTEKGPFFVYLVLRVLLPIAAMAALFMMTVVAGVIFAAVAAFAEMGMHAAFSGATGVAAAMGILIQIVMGALAVGLAVLVWISVAGPLSTAVREFALLFYGGRYQALGDRLMPPPPAAGAPAA